MKIKKISLAIIVSCLSISLAYSQNAKVQTAYNFYKPEYKQYDKAKEAIDEAVLNEKTSTSSKAWYYRGLIYQALYKDKNYGSLCNNCLQIAYDSYQKSLQLDPNNEWAEIIKSLQIPAIVNQEFNKGVEFFKIHSYKEALETFESINKMSPGDTAVILNAAYSAERAEQPDKAIFLYKKLVDMKYKDDKIYASLATLYKQKSQSDSSLMIIRAGRELYPESMNLMLTEINNLLASGKNAEATQALDAATLKDPNNQNLYLALGSTYDNLANPKDEKTGKDLPKPSQYDEYILKAETAYKKGISIGADNLELNYNLGALYFNQAAELVNKANSMKSNEDFEKAKVKYTDKFKMAIPYLEKALAVNQRKTADDQQLYYGSLNSLKQIYVRTGQTEDYNRIKALLDQK